MTVDIVPLHLGAKSVRTRLAAVAANKRLRARALEAYVCPIPTAILEDPAEPLTLDAAVLGAIAKAAWALGAHKDTIAEMRRTGVVPIGVQRLVRNPGLRPRSAAGRAQLDRAARRMRVMQAQRKRRAAARANEKAEHGATSRSRAVNAFLRSVGTTEDPPGSNGGGIITVMENYWGFGRVPWCGISAGYHAAKYGNCDLRSDVASVAAITAHARAGHSPYGSFQTGVQGALQGRVRDHRRPERARRHARRSTQRRVGRHRRGQHELRSRRFAVQRRVHRQACAVAGRDPWCRDDELPVLRGA
jgi:hypothetical protein